MILIVASLFNTKSLAFERRHIYDADLESQ